MSDSFDTDVVVAGAGAAGLAAALAAAERGADVVLIEASETFRQGSNTAMSTSMVPAGGSRWQDSAGIDDSPQRFHDDVMRKTGGAADPVVAAALTEVAPELVHWMVDHCRIPLELVTDFRYPGHSRDRCHAVPDRAGRTLHAGLLRALDASEATLIVPMRLTGVDVEDDGVAAVTAATPDGATETITTPALVLATNGFAANPAMVERYIPEIREGLYFGGDSSMGDALEIGVALGADTSCLDAYQGHGSVATPHGILATWAIVMHGGFLVNAGGRRFGDESVGYSEYAVRVLDQPGGIAWMILDGRIATLCEPFRDFQDIVEAKALRWADDAGELAGRIGCPPDALAATITGAAIDPFGRTNWESRLEPPFAAIKVTGALFHTQGGLAVDRHARVLRDGEAIRGLYAVGGAAVGMSGNGAEGYIAGNGLLGALGLGYIAGRHVAG